MPISTLAFVFLDGEPVAALSSSKSSSLAFLNRNADAYELRLLIEIHRE